MYINTSGVPKGGCSAAITLESELLISKRVITHQKGIHSKSHKQKAGKRGHSNRAWTKAGGLGLRGLTTMFCNHRGDKRVQWTLVPSLIRIRGGNERGRSHSGSHFWHCVISVNLTKNCKLYLGVSFRNCNLEHIDLDRNPTLFQWVNKGTEFIKIEKWGRSISSAS